MDDEEQLEMIEREDDMVEICSMNGRRAVSSGVPSLDGSIDSGDERALSDSDIAHAARIGTIATNVKGPSSDALEEECRQEASKRRRSSSPTLDDWEDLLGTGALFRKTLVQPINDGDAHHDDDHHSHPPQPKDNVWVTINVVDTLRGVDSHQGLRFLLGCSMVIDAWEIVITLMRVGQKDAVKTKPRLAYGEWGIPGHIPADQDQEYTIELVKIEDGPKAELMDDLEKCELAKILKERGNYFVERKDYEKAIFVYKRVMTLTGIRGDDRLDDDDLMRTLSACNSNLAICYAKIGDWPEVLEATTTALNWDPLNTKAIFWRAFAMKERNDIQQAMEIIDHGLAFDPDNKSLLSLKRDTEEKSRRADVVERAVYKRMLNGIDENPEPAQMSLLSKYMKLAVIGAILGVIAYILVQTINEHSSR